ncbi:MAG: hypothetical protein GWP16_02130 [Nitrospirae bacterium]|nr:hypothetical protein [Nitrospirota bacterium]
MKRIDHRSGSRVGVGFWFLVLALIGLSSSLQAEVVFYDPDGEPLPFKTLEEVEDFLDTADIVWKEKLESGTNKRKRKIMLEKGGVQAHAILRTGYEVKDSPGGGFVDSCHSEVAAYELSRLLGLESVPPAVRRKGGSIQIWIENATTDASRRKKGVEPKDPVAFEQQIQVMGVFDNLIANTDRNPGNILIDGDGKVWFIDHTRSFAGQTELKYPDRITGCDQEMWKRLQALSDAELTEAMRPYLRLYRNELLVRRQLVVQAIQSQIDSEGEDAVLFELARR